MDKDVAKSLLPLVSDRNTVQDLVKYAEYRISTAKNALATAKNFEEVLALQGAIRELTRLMTLKDEVHEAAKR